MEDILDDPWNKSNVKDGCVLSWLLILNFLILPYVYIHDKRFFIWKKHCETLKTEDKLRSCLDQLLEASHDACSLIKHVSLLKEIDQDIKQSNEDNMV